MNRKLTKNYHPSLKEALASQRTPVRLRKVRIPKSRRSVR